MAINLSQKQSNAWAYLEDDTTNEVLYGGGAGCFVGNTIVKTKNGYKEISKIKKGELVMSFNQKTRKFEYKKVINTFIHNTHRHNKNIIIFAFNNINLICTDNHEFYFRGTWNSASVIARRKVEVRKKHKQQIFNFKHGSLINNIIQGWKKMFNNAPGNGRKGIFENDVKENGQNRNNKNTQDCCAKLDREPFGLSTSKSQEFGQNGQQGGKFRMGDGKTKCYTCIQRWGNFQTTLHKFCQGLKNWNFKTNGRKGNGNKEKIQTKNIYKSHVGSGIWGFSCYNKGCNIKELEACSFVEELSNELFYDLEVEDNHNYLVTELDIIAHNSGKSMLGCLWHVIRRVKYPNSRGLIGRSKLKNLEESTLVTLFEICKQLGYTAGEDFTYNSQKSKILWKNGSITLLKDLFLYPSDPDFTSLGSTEFTDAFIDEVPEITKKAKDIVASRIRWKLNDFGLVPKLLMTCNPQSGWVKEQYISNNNGKVNLKENVKYIHASVFDNPDKTFVELYVKQLENLSDYDKRRLLEGDWDVKPDILNPFAYHFDINKHIGQAELQNKPLYLSIDFNLNPFGIIAAHIWNDKDGYHCHIVDEIEIYKGSIPAMIDEIKLRYGHYLHNCWLTGDAMGKRGDLSQRDNANYYLQLQRGLNLHPRQLKVLSNPTHENSRADVNYILKHFPDFKISEKCKQTIFDMRNVQCDAFGSIIKRNRTDLAQHSDQLDCCRYLINAFLFDWKKNHQKGFIK